MKFIMNHVKCGVIFIFAIIASISLIAATLTMTNKHIANSAAKEKIPEHKCCHNGQCCGTPDCCDDKGCKSAKCPAIKDNGKDKKKKSCPGQQCN